MASFAENASKLHHALASHDRSGIMAYLADEAVLHQDNTTPLNMADEADRQQLNERWDKVAIGSSQLLAHAVNEDAKTSFIYALFTDCADMNESDGGSADVTCLWHATWTQDGSKVKELVVFSAPHTAIPLKDEKAVPFDPAMFARPSSSIAVGDASKVEAAMLAFCNLYDNADVAAVPDVLSEDFYEWRLTDGRTKDGRQEIEENLKQHGQVWRQKKGAKVAAAADASSGFLAWAALGHIAGEDGTPDTSAEPMLFAGMCFALLGKDGKVTKSAHLAVNEPKSAPMAWTGF